MEVCQEWVKPGYNLILSSQAYAGNKLVGMPVFQVVPRNAILINCPHNLGGSIDHGIFVLHKNCTTLSKSPSLKATQSTKLKIVDHLPKDTEQWMSVVSVEEKIT